MDQTHRWACRHHVHRQSGGPLADSRESNPATAPPIAGFFSGALNAATGMASPPIALLFTARGYDLQAFRSSIVTYFYVIDTLAILLLVQQGLVGWKELEVVASLLPAALVGTFIGKRIASRTPEHLFRLVVIVSPLRNRRAWHCQRADRPLVADGAFDSARDPGRSPRGYGFWSGGVRLCAGGGPAASPDLRSTERDGDRLFAGDGDPLGRLQAQLAIDRLADRACR